MGTLQSHIDVLPPILKEKFKEAFWVAKGNEILERLSAEKLMRDLTYRRGVIPEDKVWITPPTNYRHAVRLHDPEDYNVTFGFIETDGKLMLIGAEVLEENDPTTLSSFSDFAAGSITVDIGDAEEGDYKDYLFRITAGTLADETIVLSGNDASAGGTTKLYFRHSASSTLSALKVTAAELIHPDYYVILIYKGSYTEFTDSTDEVPIDNNFEKRVMNAGLMMHGFYRLDMNSKQAILWTNNFEKVIQELRDEFLSRPIDVQPRKWAGLIDDDSLDYDTEEDDE